MNKKKILKWVYTFVIVLLVATFFSRSIHHLTLAKVVVDKAKSGSICTEIAFDSSLTPNDSITKYAGLSAVIESKLYSNGDLVNTGDVIYILDDTELQEESELLQYQIETLKAEISKLETQYNQLVSKMSIKYEEMVVSAERTYTKNEALFEAGNISRDVFEQSDIAYKTAQLNFQDLVYAQKDLLDDLTNELKEKQNRLEKCVKKIDSCVVVSEENGILQEMTYDKGMMVSHNSLLYKMSTIKSGYKITESVHESQGKHLNLGDEVNVEVYGKNLSITTVISDIARRENKYEVTMTIVDSELTIDDTVRVIIKKKLASYDTVLPLEAVHSDNLGEFVYVLNEKEGPLGKEYYAVKEDVTIGEKNLRSIGLETSLSKETSIIIRSTEPLFGDRIEVYIED